MRNENQIPHLTPVEMSILDLLVAKGEMYGLEIVRDSGGIVRKGTVYVTLGRMEEKNLVASREETRPEGAKGIPRRLYEPTGLGSRTLQACRLIANFMGEPSFATS